jgi:hypothetical protein
MTKRNVKGDDVSDMVTGSEQYEGELSHRPKDYRPLSSGELSDSWHLGEFLEALGPVMRLPPKESDEPPAKAAARKAASNRRAGWLVVSATALIVAAAAAGPIWRALSPTIPMPEGLVGTWATTVGRYAGRTFVLSPTTLELSQGDRSAAYPIVEVRRGRAPRGVEYSVRYRDGESLLVFAIVIDRDSVVQLRNLPQVDWTKLGRR